MPAAIAFVTRYPETFHFQVIACAVVYAVRATTPGPECSSIVSVMVGWSGVVSAQIMPSSRIIVRVGSSDAWSTPR